MKHITVYSFRKSLMLLFKGFLIAASVGIFYQAYFTYYRQATFYAKGNYLFLFFYSAVYVLFLQIYGALRIGKLRLRELAFSNAIALILTNSIAYLVISLIARALLSPVSILVSTALQTGLGVVLLWAGTSIHSSLYPPVKTVFITGGTLHDQETAKKFSNGKTRYDICAVIDVGDGIDAIYEAINRYPAAMLGTIEASLRERLLAYCFEKGKQFFVLPSMQDIMLHNASQFFAGDSITYLCRSTGFRPDQLLVKRIMDILFATAGLALGSPIMLLAALAIKVYDGGPVFYRQTRLTRNGKQFLLVKFRSMVMDAEEATGPVLAEKQDSRITPVGRVLRSARIDELPQFFNILRGDMSLVGPRPERPELFEQICSEFPQFRYRLKVKAGLTGYAQLYGRYNTAFEDKVRMDFFYIQQASLLLDLQMIFYTIKVIFMRESTEGVKRGKEIKRAQLQQKKEV